MFSFQPVTYMIVIANCIWGNCNWNSQLVAKLPHIQYLSFYCASELLSAITDMILSVCHVALEFQQKKTYDHVVFTKQYSEELQF